MVRILSGSTTRGSKGVPWGYPGPCRSASLGPPGQLFVVPAELPVVPRAPSRPLGHPGRTMLPSSRTTYEGPRGPRAMTSGQGAKTGSGPSDPLLGTGHGIDHVQIAVRDLAEASRDFEQLLGFTLDRGGSRFPSGLENKIIDLHEREYLELLAIYNPQTGHTDIREMEQFLERGEGVIGLGIRVSSAEAAASQLRKEGFQVDGPIGKTTTYPGIEESPPVFWRSIQLKTGRKFVDDVIFFSEYVTGAYAEFQARHPELPSPRGDPPNHRNSAIGGLHPWLAVASLQEATAIYERVGFPRVRSTRFSLLNGQAVELGIGHNSLVLVEGAAEQSPVHGFLRRRDSSYGLMGLSLGVRSLGTALKAIPPDVASRLESGEGLFGGSAVVPPKHAHGIWLELFETQPHSGL